MNELTQNNSTKKGIKKVNNNYDVLPIKRKKLAQENRYNHPSIR